MVSAVKSQASIDRNLMVDKFAELIDYAFGWLEPHEAQLLLTRAADDMKRGIERVELDTTVLRALKKAQADPHDCEALDAVEKAIEALTCEGSV